jgi:hypothetical protein
MIKSKNFVFIEIDEILMKIHQTNSLSCYRGSETKTSEKMRFERMTKTTIITDEKIFTRLTYTHWCITNLTCHHYAVREDRVQSLLVDKVWFLLQTKYHMFSVEWCKNLQKKLHISIQLLQGIAKASTLWSELSHVR